MQIKCHCASKERNLILAKADGEDFRDMVFKLCLENLAAFECLEEWRAKGSYARKRK